MKLSKLQLSGLGGAAFGITIIGATLLMMGLRTKAPLPSLGTIPQFMLLDQMAQPVRSDDFLGYVTVSDFIFLRCTTACPRLTSRMSELRRNVENEEKKRGKPLRVKFASFSVDPDHDTPEKLAPYANEWKAHPSTWAFLTGPTEDIQRVVLSGFKMGYSRIDNGNEMPDIMHGNYFVLSDRRGQIRGYYRTETPDEMRILTSDVLTLSAEP